MASGWIARNWFLLGLAAATGAAWLVPELGAPGGPLRPEITTRVGVAFIFFMQGLVIAPAVLRTGAMRWRLHMTTQLFIFVGFPVAMLLLDVTAGRLLPPDLRTGFLFLSIVPTTISGCVVFTARAGGNTSAALFNSATANISGVLITPLWAAVLLRVHGEAPPLGSMLGEIAMLLLAPLLLGQLIRPLLRGAWAPSAAIAGRVANMIIIYIVFAAFSSAFNSGAFSRTGPLDTLAVAAATIAIFVAATAAAVWLGRGMNFDRGDRIALLFCAPQKTLAAGAPMAQILFAGDPAVAVVLLPLMVYHAVQLLGGASLAERISRR
jgi:solute carrier family 10 (sodium/bile acid cotransporter), member 7